MFAQWAASAAQGPWMNPPIAPSASSCNSIQPAWKLKVIRCLDHKTRAYQPNYAPEDLTDEHDEQEETSWNVRMTIGTIKKNKKGRSSLRATRQDFTADASFDR